MSLELPESLRGRPRNHPSVRRWIERNGTPSGLPPMPRHLQRIWVEEEQRRAEEMFEEEQVREAETKVTRAALHGFEVGSVGNIPDDHDEQVERARRREQQEVARQREALIIKDRIERQKRQERQSWG